MVSWICKLLRCCPPTPQHFVFTASVNGVVLKGVYAMQMSLEQKVALAVAATTAAGHPARLDGPVSWASSDPNIVEVVTDVNDSSKSVAYARGVGSAQVSAVGDADLSGEVRELNGAIDIQVLEAEAAFFAITAGTPESQ